MKILLVGAELFHADGQTDRHDETNSRLFAILPKVPKILLKFGEPNYEHVIGHCVHFRSWKSK